MSMPEFPRSLRQGQGSQRSHHQFHPAAVASAAVQWKIFAWRGFCGLVFGVLALAWPERNLTSLVLLFSAYLLSDGVLAGGAAVVSGRHGRAWLAFAGEAVLDLAAALTVFAYPMLALAVMVYAAAAWAILSGGALLWASVRFGLYGWMLALAAAVSIALGCFFIIAPVEGAIVIDLWLGAYALTFGLMLLWLAWRLRRLAQ